MSAPLCAPHRSRSGKISNTTTAVRSDPLWYWSALARPYPQPRLLRSGPTGTRSAHCRQLSCASGCPLHRRHAAADRPDKLDSSRDTHHMRTAAARQPGYP